MRKQSGFSLFETILAIMISSMVVAGVAKVASSQLQSSSGKAYGQNLFTFSQAAYNCAYNHQTEVTNATFQGGVPTTGIATTFWTTYGPAASPKPTG